MPFIHHTPESLIPRSDSKNPSTTCRGVTSSGKPCRRSLAASPRNSPAASPNGGRGVLAVFPDVDGNHDGAAAFFCWQHKDQASVLAGGTSKNKQTEFVELKKRSSIDTLVGRLGVLDIEEDGKARRKRKSGHEGQSLRRDTLPQQWQNMHGPLMAVPEDPFSDASTCVASGRPPRPPSRPQPQPRPKSEGNMQFSFFCCMSSADLDLTPPPRAARHSKRPEVAPDPQFSSRPMAPIPKSSSRPSQETSSPSRPVSRRPVSTGSSSLHPTNSPHRPSIPRDPSSHTQTLLSFIPPALSPQTTSALLAELAKPLSTADHEHGYIYMFWQTSATTPAPPASAASSLLAPPSPNPPLASSRRTSDVLRDYASSLSADGTNKTIMLKIGRASNVQRRLNEWSRQCGHTLSLVRYYPYHGSSSPSVEPLPTPRKVPRVQRVERLIHLELADQRVRRACGGCGKEHREWFEVSATRNGVKGVDEVIKRWIGWAEGEAG